MADYAFDYVDLDEKAEDFRAGWEAIQDYLAEDEAFAKSLFEQFHGQEY